MFDVSFSELILILVVGLLVFGPEKLPEVIRTSSMWIAKIKRTFTQMRTEIEREMGVDELKRDLHNNAIMQNLRDVQNDLQNTRQELQRLPYDVSDVVQRANSNVTTNSPESADRSAPIANQSALDSDPTIYFDPRNPEPTYATTYNPEPINNTDPSHSAALTTDEELKTDEPSSEHKTTPDNYSAQK